jgi:hypothetical protein
LRIFGEGYLTYIEAKIRAGDVAQPSKALGLIPSTMREGRKEGKERGKEGRREEVSKFIFRIQ